MGDGLAMGKFLAGCAAFTTALISVDPQFAFFDIQNAVDGAGYRPSSPHPGRPRASRHDLTSQDRALLGNQPLDVLHEIRGWHVFSLLLAAGANVYFARFRLFVAHHQ
jgi:hypothetical protein